MDIAKIAAAESNPRGTSTPTTTAQGGAASLEHAAKALAILPATVDRVDIRPLDLSAALQILIAEVRASFDSQALLAADGLGTPGASASGANADNAQQAARALMEFILQAQPQNAGGADRDTAIARMEMMLRTGLERGISAVTSWRDVPATVVETVNETRALIIALLEEGPRNPLWLRPEWAGLAPKFERFWRRRRRARRRLTDPDYSSKGFESDEQQS